MLIISYDRNCYFMYMIVHFSNITNEPYCMNYNTVSSHASHKSPKRNWPFLSPKTRLWRIICNVKKSSFPGLTPTFPDEFRDQQGSRLESSTRFAPKHGHRHLCGEKYHRILSLIYFRIVQISLDCSPITLQ